MESDDDLKRSFINRQKRLFNNIYNQLKIANEKGILSNEQLEAYKNSYNEIVYDDAKKAYIAYKLKYSRISHKDDLFSAEV
jgi:hypothetical protein